MKEMRREELEKSIKKALEEGRDWCRIDISHCYQIMINTADGAIWTDLSDENHWKVYRSDSITTLHGLGWTVEDVEASYLADAITKLADAGWTIK